MESLAKTALQGNHDPLTIKEFQRLGQFVNSQINRAESLIRNRDSDAIKELTLIRDKLIYQENQILDATIAVAIPRTEVNVKTLDLVIGEHVEYKKNGQTGSYIGRVLESKPEKFKVQPLYRKWEEDRDLSMSMSKPEWLSIIRFTRKVAI